MPIRRWRAVRPSACLTRKAVITGWLLAATWGSTGCSRAHTREPESAPARSGADDATSIVIHDFDNGLTGVRARPEVKLRVDRESAGGREPVLLIDYPARSSDPAGRDVYFDAAHRDWTTASAIQLRVKSSHATRVSVSFLDRNHVAYTAWIEISSPAWQSIRIPFSAIRPNPYFQPPDAKRGAPLDVSDVGGFGLAPQDSVSGQIAVSRIIVVK